MVDLVLPPALRHAKSSFRYIDQTGMTRGAYNGAVQTTNYGGDRVGAAIEFAKAGGKQASEKALRRQMLAFLMAVRGKTNRVLLTDDSYVRGGSFPSFELFEDPAFESNAAWSASAGITDVVSEGVYRGTVNVAVTASTDIVRNTNAATAVQYAPYVQRWGFRQGRFAATLSVRFRNSGGTSLSSVTTPGEPTYANPNGYLLHTYVTESTSLVFALNIAATSGLIAGHYFDINFASASRCMLVDGGGNLALRSDEIDNASWTKTRTTVSANADTAPDGTATADRLIEDGTASNTHIAFQSGITRATGITDLCSYAYVRRAVGTRNFELIVGNDFTNYVRATFDLGSLATNVGNVGTATDGRAFIRDAGGGWYFCAVVGRMASATTCAIQLGMLSGSSSSYSGDSTSALSIWRAGIIQSSVPTRGAQTTGAASAVATQTGTALNVKGLPASTNGLLLAGDWVEIDGQIKMVTASLDSDAAGLGYLQFSPPLRRAVSDNTPVIVTKPMGRFIATDTLAWENDPGAFSHSAIDLEEAYS